MKPLSKNFKQLQAKWYKKLKDSGFEDVETNEHYLKPTTLHDTNYMYKRGQFLFESKIEYYRLAGMFYYDYRFKRQYDRFIWKHHSDGKSAYEILEMLNKRNITSSQPSLFRKIKKLRTLMLEFYKDRSHE